MPIKKLRHLLDSKQISAVELTNHYLDKIKKHDNVLNSFITVCEASALEQANYAQGLIDNNRQGQLCGIPIAVKDNICTKGIRTTCASGALSNFVPAYNATVVQKLLDSSAVILGKVNLDEFAMGSSNETSYFGAAKNPFDTDYITGGSSGGSAAAVSAELCAAALGSDTGGSVRQPASICGVTGFKPTYGAISRFGLVAFASSLDTIGFLTDSAEDSAFLMNCTAGKDLSDSTSVEKTSDDFFELFGKSVKGMKIGVPKEAFCNDTSPEIKKCVMSSIDFFKSCGCEIINISLNHLDYSSEIYKIISCAEASSNLARYDGIKYGTHPKCSDSFDSLISSVRSDGFGDEVKKRIMFGTHVLSGENYDSIFMKAQTLREDIKAEYKKIFDVCDLIITPTTPDIAYKFVGADSNVIQRIKSDKLLSPANLAGLPSISTPCGYSDNNIPIGLCITGAKFSDSRILATADLFEKEFFAKSRKTNKYAATL